MAPSVQAQLNHQEKEKRACDLFQSELTCKEATHRCTTKDAHENVRFTVVKEQPVDNELTDGIS